jgi:hypothetical protein
MLASYSSSNPPPWACDAKDRENRYVHEIHVGLGRTLCFLCLARACAVTCRSRTGAASSFARRKHFKSAEIVSPTPKLPISDNQVEVNEI